jgi:hypothetical protein
VSIFLDYGQAASAVKKHVHDCNGKWSCTPKSSNYWIIEGDARSSKNTLSKEYMLREVQRELEHGTISKKTVMYLVINALPCIFTWRITLGWSFELGCFKLVLCVPKLA